MEVKKYKIISLYILVSIFFANYAHSAVEDWEYVTTTGGTQVFVDPKTFKKDRNIWKISILGDGTPYKSGGYDGIPEQIKTSNKYDIEFDCSRDVYRLMRVASYSKHLGEGYIETKYVGGEWRSFNESGIIFTPVADLYCNKR